MPKKTYLKITTKMFLQHAEYLLIFLHSKNNYWNSKEINQIEENYQQALIQWCRAKNEQDYYNLIEKFQESFFLLMNNVDALTNEIKTIKEIK